MVHTSGRPAWRRLLARAVLLGVAACNETEPSLTGPGQATKLVFTVQPGTATAGTAISPAVLVAIQDASGRVVTAATNVVTVAIETNPGGGTLSGPATASPVNGLATFYNLSIDRVASGYTLSASAAGLTGATSTPFVVVAGPAAQLAFAVEPSSARTGNSITPAVQVVIQDAFGNTAPTATNIVTAALANNPGAGTLSGTTSVTPVNGRAIFSDLSVDKEGTGYTLAASADGLTAATSVAFDIHPPLNFVTVAAGGSGSGSHTCGVTTTGDIYCWGFNGRGQLGDNSQAIRYVPTLVQAPGVTFQTVSAGGQHTCAVASTGDAYCWGRNEFGRLGDGTTTDRTAPVRVAPPAGVTFTAVSAGAGHSCALATGGNVYCWGSNYYGQLGDGSGNDQDSPSLVQAPAGVTFTAVTTGSFHSCGLATSGAVYCWGSGGAGQLGDNTTTDAATPVQASAPAGVTFAALDAGYAHTCAVTPAGAAYCWGANSGRLGDNTTDARTVPTLVQGGLQFGLVSGGAFHTCGVTTGGVGYCWGPNGNGQIGDNTTVVRLTPQTVFGNLSFTSVAAGPYHSCALATGTGAGVYCWGYNGTGELGDGTTIQRLVPTRVQQ